jgi:hypothetical protein
MRTTTPIGGGRGGRGGPWRSEMKEGREQLDQSLNDGYKYGTADLPPPIPLILLVQSAELGGYHIRRTAENIPRIVAEMLDMRVSESIDRLDWF